MKNLIKNKSTKKATKNNNNFITPSYITRAGSLLNGVVDGGMAKQGFYDTESSIPNFYTPELTPDTWLLPRSRAEILRWCRLFFNLDPYINSILTMHAQYPICNFRLSYKDKDTEEFFNRKLFFNKEFSWIDFLEQLMLSYLKLGEACLTGDTRIKLLDGTSKTLEELYNSKAENFYVYSVDERGNIVPGKADSVVLTRKNAEILKVTLDNGEYFKCTPDHKIMLRDGSYKEAQDLKEGDALMPLYFKDSYTYYNKHHSKHKYELIYNPGNINIDKNSGHWKFTHRVISLAVNGASSGKIIHHKNFNSKDNRPENLQVLSHEEHRAIHAKEYTEEEIENFRQKTKALYDIPGYREKMGKAIKKGMTKRVRKILSEKSKLFWGKEENREMARKNSTGRKHTPETIAKMKAIAKERYLKNPEEVMRRLKKATETAAILNKGSKHTEEYKQKMSQMMKDKWEKGIYKNHKVAKIEPCGFEDVFDIHSSGEYHNFAIETGEGSGIFVHNCVWGDFSEANGTWTNFTLIDPALINYKEDPMSGDVEMSIIPTRELKEMIADALKQGRQDVPIEYIKCVQENHEIPLDASEVEANYLTGRKYSPARVFMMARRTDPASTRGVPMIQCARYNTKIKLLDGTIKTIGELFDSKAKNFYVYSVDEKGNIVPKKATKVIYRGKKQTYDVLLDNGEVLGFTADHPFLMRDGSWKEVKDLKPGDSLMPLYVRDSKIGNGYYEQVYNPNKDKWEFTHRLVELDGKFKGCVIHHKNFNKKDNRPENLQVLSFKDHVKYHQELIKQSREKLNESLKKYRTTDKFKENCKKQSLWASKAVAEYWKDPAYRQKQAEYKEKRAEGVRNAYLTTDLHNKIQEGHNRFLKDYYKNDILFDKIVSLKDGYIITDGGKETGNHYKRLIQTLGLPLKVVSENNKTVIFSANIDIKEVISKELINIRSSFYNSVIQKIKDAFNQKVDYIILDNEEFNLTDRNKSSTLKKALHKYGIDLEVSMLKGFGSTIIYKKSDKDVASLFKRNSESIEYSKVSKDRALNALDCESVVNELMYSKNPTQKILDFNKSHIRQLRAYINRLNLPITVNKCNNNIVLNRIWNHKVVSVTPSIVEDVYDIECVDGTHNFAVACSDGSGVFVHNCLFKSLIYSDKIKLAQVATADRLHLPIEIWSVGQYTGDPNTSIIPDDTMLANVREAIREATMQPPFSIFVPPYIKYEAVGVNGKLLSVYEDLGYVENCIFVALGVNKNLILGQGPSFSSSKQTSLFKLIKMYKMMRLKLEAFIKRYIILPIAKANDIKDEYGEYVVPEIEWEESLQPEQDVEMFNNVLKLWDKGLVSTMTLYEYFPGQLDINLEKKRMEEEKRSVFDKGTDRLGAKSLREDLKEDSPESKSTPKPSDGKGPAKDMPSPISGGEALEGLEKGEEATPPEGGAEPTPPTPPEGLEGE